MLQHQQFEKSRNDETEPRGSKCQLLDKYNKKKENSLNKNEIERKNTRYISFSFISLLFFRKMSNCPSDLGKRNIYIKNLLFKKC